MVARVLLQPDSPTIMIRAGEVIPPTFLHVHLILVVAVPGTHPLHPLAGHGAVMQGDRVPMILSDQEARVVLLALAQPAVPQAEAAAVAAHAEETNSRNTSFA